MIAFNLSKQAEAKDKANLQFSPYTSKEFTYTYYCELCKKFRERSLEDSEYFDWEVLMYKYDTNRRL